MMDRTSIYTAAEVVAEATHKVHGAQHTLTSVANDEVQVDIDANDRDRLVALKVQAAEGNEEVAGDLEICGNAGSYAEALFQLNHLINALEEARELIKRRANVQPRRTLGGVPITD